VTSRWTLIAQISDLHIKRPGELAYQKVDTAAALTCCIDTLHSLVPRPELVVVTGDLVDTPAAEEYEHLACLLAPLELPLAVIPGNHDSRTLLRAAFPAQPYARADGALDFTLAVGELNIILLDSSVPATDYGELGADTLAWLDAMLARDEQRPALLFLHHPPFLTGVEHMDRQNLHNAEELAKVLQRHPRVRLIAAGHVHRSTHTLFAGVPTNICPAPNHAVALDLCGALPPSLKVEPPGLHLHAWDRVNKRLITHLVPIGHFPGPYPFFNGAGRQL
jgi:3',5'-cyclic AMP phosphodiesterase CpdA